MDGLHSVENRDSYKRVFSIDEKNRRSRTGSFFDIFLGFSGWCGVRGSSEVTLASQDNEGRLARVYSKALVEANKKTC